MSLPKVFVTREIPAAGLDLVRESCETEVWPGELPPPKEVILDKIKGCDGLLSLLTATIDAEIMDAAPNLKIISNYAVGFNNIDVAAATERGILVGNTPGVLTDATADMAFALLISAARRIVETHQYTLDGKWKTWEPLGHIGQDMAGKTIGIVGLGRIGYAMAKRCFAGWDMKILYSGRSHNEEAEKNLKAEKVDLDTLLAESDFVSVHAALNDDTKGMFDLDKFKKMKSSAVFINTARGAHVVQPDLCAALKTGEIFAAGIDVTDPEPILMDDELLKQPNCIIAPHIASATVSTRNAMAQIAANNLIAGLKGESLQHCVNPEVQP